MAMFIVPVTGTAVEPGVVPFTETTSVGAVVVAWAALMLGRVAQRAVPTSTAMDLTRRRGVDMKLLKEGLGNAEGRTAGGSCLVTA
ncbi:hypothetical protein [Streptacidiphilus fuscans]|uniref:Uncharacterized protein n=1 Tax=Streptacidiphilus fuscans TaxID=2789292 RepID=A0A931FF63_9ACTN|nr:hypothetical protein [Streptacidiphilus fuscans]MBF9068119.1 hypothetical protein [Streptacidiphilus fuscans]